MKLMYVTLTGADNSVKPSDLARLSKKYPYVEWAVLFSQSKTGQPRYPTWDWVKELVKVSEFYDKEESLRIQLSAHLCGKWVDDIMGGNFTFLRDKVSEWFDRIQLNMGKDRLRQCMTHQSFLDTAAKTQPHSVILGGNYKYITVDGKFFLDNWFLPLFDASGGRGVETKEWPKPFPETAPTGCHLIHGYAGGLGPDNVAEELKRIEEVVGTDSPEDYSIWIDMESKLRTKTGNKDVFDLEKCEQVLKAAAPWVR